MLRKIIRFFWGDISPNELKKFLLLALGFFFIIGSYWPLKTLKESIFTNFVGPECEPIAKILSLFASFLIVLGYSRLVDIFSKQKIIYLVTISYGFVGLIFASFLYHPVIGVQNTATSPYRLIGWFFFLFIESYIALMVPLYWSFINDIVATEDAKKGYGLIIFGAQFGGFLFTLFGNILSSDISSYATNVPFIALSSFALFFSIPAVVFILMKSVNPESLKSYQEKCHIETTSEKKSIGFFDGLKVLLTQPYVAGIFGVIFFHEAISTIMYFQLPIMVKKTYLHAPLINKFFFDYALSIQAVACLFGLTGTSFFQRRYGIKFCIIAYPITLGAASFYYFMHPTISTIFYVMLVAKALNYAFNQPTREVLYIPTSTSIKYKAKMWNDMFGMRFAKSFASSFNRLTRASLPLVAPAVFCLIALWLCLARMLGNRFNQVTKEKKIIE